MISSSQLPNVCPRSGRRFSKKLVRAMKLFGHKRSVIQRYFERATATLKRAAFTRMINHDPPHELRGRSNKMGAILPVTRGIINREGFAAPSLSGCSASLVTFITT